jgi:hypothetical protein
VIEPVGGADEDRTHDLLNAIQALSQLSYGPTGCCKVANVLSLRKFRWRRAFYGSALGWRNAESEGGKAAVGQWCVLALALAPEARVAGFLGVETGAAAEAGGGEASGEEELKIEN